MAVEDVDWADRYGDQSYKRQSLSAIWVTMLALFFSQAVVLPTMFPFLLSLHSRTLMLGYCLSATCVGELCSGPLLSLWYEKRPAKEVVIVALLVNMAGSLLYAVAPHRVAVLFARYLVGCGCGVQGILWTMLGSFTNKDNRADVIGSTRMLRHLGFILGAGMAALASWQHDSPQPFDRLDRAIPGYVDSSAAVVSNGTVANVTISMSMGGIWGGVAYLSGFGKSIGKELDVTLRDLKRKATSHARRGPGRQREGEIDGAGGPWMLRQLVDGHAVTMNEQVQRQAALGLLAHAPGVVTGGNVSQVNATGYEGWTGPDGVETDEEIGGRYTVNGLQLYIPGYITWLVGEDNLRAPGYLGAMASLVALFYVWYAFKEGPRKYLSQHVPMAQLMPRTLRCFAPLAACVGLEAAAQFAIVALDTVVPPLINMWEVWSPDALAVYMMGLASLGVLGYAVQEPLQSCVPVRHLMLGAALILLIGTTEAVSWSGHLMIWRYTLGLALTSFACAPLSTMANQVVNRAVIKTYSEEGAMVWLQLFWYITSVPARVLGPLVLTYALESDESGGWAYMCILVVSLTAVAVLVFYQSELITPQVGEDAEVLPGSQPSITGDIDLHRYAPLSP